MAIAGTIRAVSPAKPDQLRQTGPVLPQYDQAGGKRYKSL
jgi:hypothetical protein